MEILPCAQYTLDGWTHQFHIVPVSSLNGKPSGTPCPSVNKLRFSPLLARLVGLGPVTSPPKGAFTQPGLIQGFPLTTGYTANSDWHQGGYSDRP